MNGMTVGAACLLLTGCAFFDVAEDPRAELAPPAEVLCDAGVLRLSSPEQLAPVCEGRSIVVLGCELVLQGDLGDVDGLDCILEVQGSLRVLTTEDGSPSSLAGLSQLTTIHRNLHLQDLAPAGDTPLDVSLPALQEIRGNVLWPDRAVRGSFPELRSVEALPVVEGVTFDALAQVDRLTAHSASPPRRLELPALEVVTESIRLSGAVEVVDLPALRRAARIEVADVPVLTDLRMPAAIALPSLTVEDAPNLDAIQLGDGARIDWTRISDADRLATLSLGSGSSVEDLSLIDLPGLQSMPPVEARRGGEITIERTALTELPLTFESPQVDVLVRDCPALDDLSAFEGVEAIGRVELESLPELVSLEPLGSLLEVDDLVLRDLPRLTTVDGLDNLVTGGIALQDNPLLTDLSGLARHSVAARLFIQDNASLQSLEGLEMLQHVSGDLRIEDNPRLDPALPAALLQRIGEQNVHGRVIVQGNGVELAAE